jgi:RHS repeat-associated protein
VHGPGANEPLLWYEGTGLTLRRGIVANHQGSIISMADASGASFATNAYDAYGVPNSTNLGRFQYTGQAWLAELGLYYYKARLYAPSLGRFLQTDPIGYDDEVNLYTYVRNDPVANIDSTGRETRLAVSGRTDDNPFGHVALIVNNTVYSYGTDWAGGGEERLDWGANAQPYLAAVQSQNRQTQLMTLKTTPVQEQQLQQYLEAHNPNAPGGEYNVLTNNCATVVQDALVKTGTMPRVLIGPTTARAPIATSTDWTNVPSRVGANAQDAGIVQDVETVGKPPTTSAARSTLNAVSGRLRSSCLSSSSSGSCGKGAVFWD